MKVKEVKVLVEGLAGWARDDTLPQALRKMIEYSRGYINPKKMTLAEFIVELERQNVMISLQIERDGKMVNLASLGDAYNDAVLLVEED